MSDLTISERDLPEVSPAPTAHLRAIQAGKSVRVPLPLAPSVVRFQQSGTGAALRTAEDKLREWITPEDFQAVGNGVADDTVPVQRAINAAAGGEVRFRPGATYRITSPLTVPSNTIIRAHGATVLRGANINNLIRNAADGVIGGYSAARNITIDGGTWDGNNATALGYGPCTAIAFGHATRVRVLGATILRVPHWHHIELNGSSNAWIDRCVFLGGAEWGVDTAEAIQLDHAVNDTSFPWFGPYDGTPCSGVRVTNCIFDANGSGVGTHSAPGTGRHQDIVIEGCTFFNPFSYGVRMYQWSGVRVSKNRFQGGYTGIFMQSANNQVCRDVLIQGNTFYNIGASDRAGDDGSCIRINGTSESQRYQDVRIIDNSMIDMNDAHGSTALAAFYVDRMIVANNVVHDPIHHGLWLQGVKYATVSGNSLYGAADPYHDLHVGYAGTPDATVEILMLSNSCGRIGLSNTTRCMLRQNICASLSQTGTHTNTSVGGNLIAGVLG